MTNSLITKRERKTIRRLAKDYPAIAGLCARIEAAAEDADAFREEVRAEVEAAERPVRDMDREAVRLRRRVAELESRHG